MNQLELLTVHDPTSYKRILLHSSVDWCPNNRKFLDQMQLLPIKLYLADKSKLVFKFSLHILSLRFKEFLILSANYF